MVTQKISFTPHVKKFLVYHFGTSYHFSRKDWFGAMLAGILKKGYRTSLVKHGECVYPVSFSEDTLERLGRHINWDNTIYINIGVDKMFRAMMFQYIDINRKLNRATAKQCMLEFLAEYGISEQDISIETLYKDYQRKQRYPKTTKTKLLLQI